MLGEHVLRGCLLGRALAPAATALARAFGDVRQDLLLEAHVALDGVHEVRDQVVPALELDLDLGESLIDAESLLDQAVVDPDREDDQQDDDADDDDGREIHAPPPVGRAIAAAICMSLAVMGPRTGGPIDELVSHNA